MSVTHLTALDITQVKRKAIHGNEFKARKARKILRILERDNFKCVTCNRTKNLTVAHIKPIGRHRPLSTYNPNNCKILCTECHILVDHTYNPVNR